MLFAAAFFAVVLGSTIGVPLFLAWRNNWESTFEQQSIKGEETK